MGRGREKMGLSIWRSRCGQVSAVKLVSLRRSGVHLLVLRFAPSAPLGVSSVPFVLECVKCDEQPSQLVETILV